MFTEFNFEATFNSFKNNGGTGRNVINFNSIPPLSSPYEECVFSELFFQSYNYCYIKIKFSAINERFIVFFRKIFYFTVGLMVVSRLL